MVYKGTDLQTGTVVALKYIVLTKLKKKQLNVISGEIELLKKFEHKNIIKVLDSVQRTNSLTFVLEYMDHGSLASYVAKWGAFPEEVVANYIYQALKGNSTRIIYFFN